MSKKKENYYYWKIRRALIRFLLTDRQYTERRFRKTFGYVPDWNHPRTLNEKVNWLKLFYRKSQMTLLADKASAPEYIKARIGERYVPKVLDIYDNVESLLARLPTLPSKFVLKAAHGSGWNIFVHDKAQLDKTDFKTMRRWLSTNYYHRVREWPYKDIPPRIVSQEFLEPSDPRLGLVDYKYYCFHGQPEYLQVDVNRYVDHRRNYYDLSWRQIPVKCYVANYEEEIPRPHNHRQMIEFARILSEGWPLLRVDFFSTSETLVGELTFFPDAGLVPFNPDEYDLRFGEYLNVDEIRPESA